MGLRLSAIYKIMALKNKQKRKSAIQQQPTERQSLLLVVLLGILTISLCILFFQQGPKLLMSYYLQRDLTDTSGLKVQIETAQSPISASRPISDKEFARIRKAVDQQMTKDPTQLKKIAAKIQSNGLYDEVNVAMTSQQNISVKLHPRVKHACIRHGKNLRFVSRTGTAFGLTKACSDQITLLGILSGSDKLLPTKRVATTAAQNQLILQSVKLTEELKALDVLRTQTVRWVPHRGFRFTAEIRPHKHTLTVDIGQAPFTSNISKLRKLLNREELGKIEKIELDYQGKAFIKRKRSVSQGKHSGKSTKEKS